MTPIDAYASRPHYLSHLLPVWLALPRDMRGVLHVASRRWAALAALPGHEVAEGSPRVRNGRPLLVASYADAVAGRRARRSVALMEHGVGQTYTGVRHGAYAGGPGREMVTLFLCPTEAVAAANRAAYPDVSAVVIGSPRLDRHLPTAPRPAPDRPAVAVTFHWDAHLVPETRSALTHYARALPALARDRRWSLVGHGHPRAAALPPLWRHLGVRHEPDFDEVLGTVDVLVGDNTSGLYEAVALGVPVVVLDAPWYRRDVEHGLRFWEHADAGVRIGDPANLSDAVAAALADPPDVAARRAAVVEAMWGPLLDGGAASRAAAALRGIIGG